MEPPRNTSNEPPKSPMQNQSSSPGSVGVPSIGSDARELASQVVDRAKGLAHEKVDDQQEKSAGQIGQLARALHHTSEEVTDTMAAPYIDKAADLLDRLSGSVRDASLRGTIDDTERFARRQPLLFLGGAFTLGLLAARFFKSSERHDDDVPFQKHLTEKPGATLGRGRQ